MVVLNQLCGTQKVFYRFKDTLRPVQKCKDRPHTCRYLFCPIYFLLWATFSGRAQKKRERRKGEGGGGETCKCEFCHYLTLPFFLFPFFAPGKAVAAISESFLLPPRNSATAEDVDTQQTATSPPAQSRGAVAENETPHIPVGKMTWAQWGVRKGVRGYFLGGTSFPLGFFFRKGLSSKGYNHSEKSKMHISVSFSAVPFSPRRHRQKPWFICRGKNFPLHSCKI